MSRSTNGSMTEQPAEHRPDRGPAPDASQIRFRVDPADVPPEKAAKRLHLTPQQFNEVLPRLLERGFPAADETTGMYDLQAIDAWRARRLDADARQTPPTHGPLLHIFP